MNSKDMKIFSINLTEVLIHDYLMIRSKNLIDDDSIIVVNNEKNLENPNKKLFLIDASKSYLLKNKNINLFINMVSMQEMNFKNIEHYFQIIKSNSAYFYCCNRVSKKLPDNTLINFSEYGWLDKDIIIFDELCPWHQEFPINRPPFTRKFDGRIQHRLIKLI